MIHLNPETTLEWDDGEKHVIAKKNSTKSMSDGEQNCLIYMDLANHQNAKIKSLASMQKWENKTKIPAL
jgi:hypothetical protein